jgi:putative PIN family toxin of toxin-antitoxin system
MQKIILDTNVIVSALISRSAPTQIVYECVLEQAVMLCLSDEIMEEYVEVLGRGKFSKVQGFRQNADVVLSKIRQGARFYEPRTAVELLRDVDDNKFLELALASSADFLITGNTQDFTITEFEYTRIVTPREYWDLYRP